MNQIAIRGDGVAASCCAYLLGKAGLSVTLHPLDRPRLPAILLGDHALALIRDIFQRGDLFQDAPQIRKRMVAWGANSNVLTLEHSAVVVSEERLLKELSRDLALKDPNCAPDWTIYASRPLPAPVEEHPFGSRMASAVPVNLRDNSDPTTCWIESLEDGWLFLIPTAPQTAWLLAVGNAPSELLTASRVIREQMADAQPEGRKFPAYPRIISPLCAEGWLASGTAAMAFDPLCGDGTAHAIREAILASAVIRAAANDDVLAHYQARLTAGFRRHLALCQGFYSSGGDGPWWRRELDSIQQGISWCDRKLAGHGDFRYQLRDFELHPLR
jgi:2-polyprenyl-6-methoxyphenol hydroxylase-like FAD-dependent oxidoreductase